MKRFLLLTIFGTASLFAQNSPLAQVVLSWKNVLPRYTSFDQIKPLLVNGGKKSVFLGRLYPDSSARLQRFNEKEDKWESGTWTGTCATVADAEVPIEVKAQTEREAVVYWQLSTDDWDKPHFFVVAELRAKRPIEGKYRFSLRYSLEPWALGHWPKAIYVIMSPEFIIEKK
jgi:hypothetical protein